MRESVVGEFKMDDSKTIKAQEKSFTRWVNVLLSKRGLKCNDLYKELCSDGVLFCHLIELCCGKNIPYKWSKHPKGASQKIANFSTALHFLTHKENVKLVNIDAGDFMDKIPKLVLGVLWTLIKTYQVEKNGKDRVTLLEWVNERILPFSANIPQCTNFTTSFQDGLALCGLCESTKMGLIDLIFLDDPLDAARSAITLSDDHFDVAPLVDAEDVVGAPEEHSMITYISLFREYCEGSQAEPDPELCAAEGAGVTNGVEGDKLLFVIFSRNQDGLVMNSAAFSKFEVSVMSPSEVAVTSTVEDNQNGTFSGSYVAEEAGTYKVSITYDNTEIKGSTFQCTVLATEREEIEPPAETTVTILDECKNFRAYISLQEEGAYTCYNKYGDVIGYINADEHYKNGEVGSPDMVFWGNIETGIIYDSTERRIAEIDQGRGTFRNSHGSTVCEINSMGEATGASGSLIGVIENFSYHKLELMGLYFFLVDDDMLVEFREEE